MPVITTNYQMREGFGGLPVWDMWGWMTWDSNTRAVVEANLVPEERLKLVALPNSRNIVAMRTDGVTLVTVNLTPPGMPTITGVVLIGPVQYGVATPVQPSGTYSGQRLCQWACRAQQTTP